MKAKYYVDYGVIRKWVNVWNGDVSGGPIAIAKWLAGDDGRSASTRVRYRGKVIARWKHGKRVK